MASSVFYKFKSQREESRITFDGTGISVFDLKREIILANNLGKANDFDLYIYDSKTNEEYTDDSQIIQRSSSVVVKRMPSQRPGKGKAAMYLAGASNALPSSETVQRPGNNAPAWHKGAMSKRFDREENAPVRPLTPPPLQETSATADNDEAAAMAAMFRAQTANWEETQEKMSHATRIYNNPRGTGFGRGGKTHGAQQPQHGAQQPDRPLPPSYVCYRCGQKGHWIKDCPTNNDREFDNRPRIKRTTGIPRSMLKTVENPDAALMGQGVMVTPEGGYVVAQPDSAAWQKQVSRPKGLTAAEIRERVPSDPSLTCPIDNLLFRDAVKTPCCHTSYCEDCIQSHLLERDFICPNCGKKVASLDKLEVDKPTRTKVTDYIENAVEESKQEGGEDGVTALAGPSMSNDEQNLPILDQDLYTDQQPGMNLDLSQMVTDSIPMLQAQLSQISVMLQNPSLPKQVRQTTEMQYQQLQMQLQQAQAMSVAFTLQQQQQQQVVQQHQQQQQNMNTGGYNNVNNRNIQQGGGFQNNGEFRNRTNPYSSQAPASSDSAYQRLPINNRRRNLKRDRPSDFLEVAGDTKTPRYWE